MDMVFAFKVDSLKKDSQMPAAIKVTAVSGFIEVISLDKLFRNVMSNCQPTKTEHPNTTMTNPIKCMYLILFALNITGG